MPWKSKKAPYGAFVFLAERAGLSERRDERFALLNPAAPVLNSNRVLILNHTRREKQWAPNGALCFSWRRGRDCRFATGHAASPLRPSNGGFSSTPPATKRKKDPFGSFLSLAERVGWSLRDRKGGFAAACVEQWVLIHHPLPPHKKKTHSGLFLVWRRGWDSNPRYGKTVHLISNQALSTTQTPLQSVYQIMNWGARRFFSG